MKFFQYFELTGNKKLFTVTFDWCPSIQKLKYLYPSLDLNHIINFNSSGFFEYQLTKIEKFKFIKIKITT